MKARFVVLFLAFSAALWITPAFAGDSAIILHVEGMTCPACAASVEKELTKLSEVVSVTVSLRSNTAALSLKQGQKPSQERLQQAIEAAGFQLTKVEVPIAK